MWLMVWLIWLIERLQPQQLQDVSDDAAPIRTPTADSRTFQTNSECASLFCLAMLWSEGGIR